MIALRAAPIFFWLLSLCPKDHKKSFYPAGKKQDKSFLFIPTGSTPREHRDGGLDLSEEPLKFFLAVSQVFGRIFRVAGHIHTQLAQRLFVVVGQQH